MKAVLVVLFAVVGLAFMASASQASLSVTTSASCGNSVTYAFSGFPSGSLAHIDTFVDGSTTPSSSRDIWPDLYPTGSLGRVNPADNNAHDLEVRYTWLVNGVYGYSRYFFSCRAPVPTPR